MYCFMHLLLIKIDYIFSFCCLNINAAANPSFSTLYLITIWHSYWQVLSYDCFSCLIFFHHFPSYCRYIDIVSSEQYLCRTLFSYLYFGIIIPPLQDFLIDIIFIKTSTLLHYYTIENCSTFLESNNCSFYSYVKI